MTTYPSFMPKTTFPYIVTLGPEGTFSDEATKKVRDSNSKVIFSKTAPQTILKVANDPDLVGVVPVENSVAGIVAPVQEMIVSEKMVILAEINLPIRHAFLADVPVSKVDRFFAHPQAFEQCSKYVAKHLVEAEVIFTDSNIHSGVEFLDSVNKGKTFGAIVPVSFAEKNPGYLIDKDIQDYSNNTTRFFVIRKRNVSEKFDFIKRKTSLFVEFDEDRAGLLYDLLSIFNKFGINLCRLESRPSKHKPWFYVFYVDFYNSDKTEDCLKSLEQSTFFHTVLGSYNLID